MATDATLQLDLGEDLDALENLKIQKRRKKINTERADTAAAAIDNLDTATIFTMFTNAFLHSFFESTGRYIFFPISAAMAVTRGILSIREAHLKKWKTAPVAKMLVESIGAVAVVVAVTGALVFPVMFVVIAPAIFASVIAAKSLYNAIACVTHAVIAARATDEKKRQKNFAIAATHGGMALALGLAAVGVVAVFLLGKVALAAFAITGGLVGATVCTINLVRAFRKKADPVAQSTASDNELAVDLTPEPAPSPEPGPKSSMSLMRRFLCLCVADPESKREAETKPQTERNARSETGAGQTVSYGNQDDTLNLGSLIKPSPEPSAPRAAAAANKDDIEFGSLITAAAKR